VERADEILEVVKRLGVWLPRWNHLKTLLPVMEEARARGIQVEVVCGSSDGKPELSAAPIIHRLAGAWPWAHWGVALGHGYDAVIAHGVVHNEKVIKSSGVPWVAVDHLHENAWWYLTGHQELWYPWHRVCLSGAEADYLPHPPDSWTVGFKAVRTGYTALDGPHDTPAEIRKAYGLPDRYLLVGTAVQASTITGTQWRGYFRGGPWKMLAGYKGPSYAQIIRILHDYTRATGMALVGKSRWKHETHLVHRLFDDYFDDQPTDPARALRLMQGAAMYAGGISGLAGEALAAGTPTVNWTYYPPLLPDPPGFRFLRQDLWIDGIWQAPGIGKLFRVYDPVEWRRMVDLLNTTGPGIYHHTPSSYATRVKVVGSGGASAKVLEACGL
jgi:hypothetical protein